MLIRNLVQTCAAILILLTVAGSALAEGPLPLTDFETEADARYAKPPNIVVVEAHAKTGTHALRITHPADQGYYGLRFDTPDMLKIIRAGIAKNPILTMDIFNPQDKPISFSASGGDHLSKDYGSRYNEDGLIAPPGWSTFRLNMTGLLCSNSRNFSQRRPLDASQLRFITLFLCPHKGPEPIVLYLDNVRLEGHGLPFFEGLKAFDIGPSASAVFPGFTGVNEKKIYTPGAGFGWKGPMSGWFRSVTNPDDLAGDFGSGAAFLVELAPGSYVVNVCIDQFGEWGTPPRNTSRTIELNGKAVWSETLSGEEFLRKKYLRFEQSEDTPWTDLWEDRVKAALPIRSFKTEVGADGLLTLRLKATGGTPATLSMLVAYPAGRAVEGEAFMASLDKVRKEAFRSLVVFQPPAAEGPAPEADAADKTRGFIPFVRHTQKSIAAGAVPASAERNTAVSVPCPPGERVSGQIGLFPLEKVSELKVTVSDLAGPAGASIPASAVTVRKIRNFAARGGSLMRLVPRILQPFKDLELRPGLTRGLWLTIQVPAGTAAGLYKGTLSIDSGDKHAGIAVKVTVLPFTLDKADDVVISCTGTRAAPWRGWYPDLEDRWWRIAEKVAADQAAHGMNALTGGPGFKLKGIKDGKAEIDFTDADRWMALANRYGLTMRGDSYQGFDVQLGFWVSQGPDCMAQNEANARRLYGISFSELIGIVYAEVQTHAEEAGWPPRSYYLLDEPRPEHGNVQSALEYLKLCLKAAPKTLFTGYYSPGAGREPYFQSASISIAHHTEASLAACIKAGKEAWTYCGGGGRGDIGRWLFVARRKGLTGFLRNGYMYVNADPYYDFSDVEGAWSRVWPTFDGIASTVGWERTAEGVMDYRYLKTLQARIEAAGKNPAKQAAVKAAEEFLRATLKDVTLGKTSSGDLSPEGWTAFRAGLIRHLGDTAN
ncbi:glycoside hydrolase domain-containing protein [Planctomycetota bacterium]